ncbi:MAG: hypothetical protein LLG13_16340 [Bacteroidales bacterium]|nr:hypothetical protein [Bacteroidales bacterium]
MKSSHTRRHFIKTSAINAIGIGLASNLPVPGTTFLSRESRPEITNDQNLKLPFIPKRAASWWCDLEDLLWPQKKVTDSIKRRAESFANAKIDTAINFGFHIRFDFSNYFGQLHGYYANVCEELHKYDIKFIDHYSCNHVERPRGEEEFRKLHKGQRHHILLFHDPVAAQYAQYEGHFFNDICEVDLRDGTRGYARQYQMEAFCHNNPEFLDMHKKYLQRLMKEVPFDGIEVDDMCDYAGLTTCGCDYCRERFKRDYGHEIPAFGEKYFWGDTTKNMLLWGNYENPVFRDWIRMKIESVADHVKMVKGIVGNKPLMSCCSSTGPITLNSIALNLEKLSPYLDFFMLENVGTNINCVNWVRMDAEALQQKDIAQKRGNAPAMALSYTIYDKGGYLGWCLSRFWGVANWSSTLNQRLEEDPPDAMEIEDIIGNYNNWEIKNSDLNYTNGKDFIEVRLVSSSFCRDNGWHGSDGFEQWDKVKAWSASLVKKNIGYRFVRSMELSNPIELCKDNTPLILDGLGCVSDNQFSSVQNYLSKGGTAWLALPFGTHDEKGYKRSVPLSEKLLKSRYKNLVIIDSATSSNPIETLIQNGMFRPALKQLSGDTRWAARIRFYEYKPVIHFMNTALIAIPHPIIKDNSGVPILKDIESEIRDNDITYEFSSKKISLSRLSLKSPELGEETRKVDIHETKNGYSTIKINLDGVKVYALVQ